MKTKSTLWPSGVPFEGTSRAGVPLSLGRRLHVPMRFLVLAAMTLSVLFGGASACSTVPDDAQPIVVTATGSFSSAQLSDLLPIHVSFSDSMGTAVMADLPENVDIDMSRSVAEYATGDVLYWPSENRLVVPISDGAALPDGGLILIGHISSGLNFLIDCTNVCSTRLVADGPTT